MIEELRALIRKRYGTAHALCRNNAALKRSTVYLLLSGKYPGNAGRQIGRILEILERGRALPGAGQGGAGGGSPTSDELNGGGAPGQGTAQARPQVGHDEIYAVLQEAKCAHCRRLDKRGCPECNTRTTNEAQALADYLAFHP